MRCANSSRLAEALMRRYSFSSTFLRVTFTVEPMINEGVPDVKVLKYQERLTSENVDRIFDDGWDVIVDGCDNFPTRYLINDASLHLEIPVVHGAIFRFEDAGLHRTVHLPHRGQLRLDLGEQLGGGGHEDSAAGAHIQKGPPRPQVRFHQFDAK